MSLFFTNFVAEGGYVLIFPPSVTIIPLDFLISSVTHLSQRSNSEARFKSAVIITRLNFQDEMRNLRLLICHVSIYVVGGKLIRDTNSLK